MKTVLFVVGPALGHVGRSLVIARAVAESAPDIRIVLAHVFPGHGGQLLQPEFECIPIHYQDRGDEGFADLLELTMMTVGPDLICLDLSPTPWLCLVRFPEIPRVYITNFFLTSLTSTETVQDVHLQNSYMNWNQRRLRRGLPELHDAKALYDTEAVLLCDPIELIASHTSIAAPYHAVGPCIWQPKGSLPRRFVHSRRLLLVSLGSTGDNRHLGEMVEKLRRVLECEASLWVTGKKPSKVCQGFAPTYSDIPLWPILQKSVLAITQGGAGSTYAALLEGVPVAVWPSHRNHQILGEMLTRAGVGVLVTELANLGPEEIRMKVAGMENESRQFKKSSDNEFGPAKAADFLVSLI